MRQRLFIVFALLCSSLAAALGAATFELGAAVDHDEVELGEAFHYSLSLQVKGRMDFPVQIDQPKFEGFQVQGPSRQDGSSWVNGAVSEQHVFTWELIPIKAGTLSIPAIRANSKDAVNGEVSKTTPAITITVRRPKNAYSAAARQPNAPAALPSYPLQAQATPEPGVATPNDDGLRDIKADRGLPWMALAGVFGAFAGVLALLLWWAKRPSAEEDVLPTVRDPRAAAFKQLDAALLRLKAGDEKGFSIGVGQALRAYLRQRLDLRQESTLAEATGACIRRLPDAADKENAQALRFRLEHLLYGDAAFKESDRELLDRGSRDLINLLERLAGR